ncbi:MAG: hypothetical protein LQ345_004342 [Seirophora villosa]|nr:MAG: hypothetical protein LQ345_004342 [Seirophora villosa]
MAPSPAPQPAKEKPKRKPAGRADGGYKIGGTVLPWDPDLHLDKAVPTPLFPPYTPSHPAPLNAAEKAHIATFRRLRACIHEGPFYTVLDHDAGKSKTRTDAAASFDPFEGMPTYILRYFPKELWPTLDPKLHSPSHSLKPSSTSTTIRKTLLPKPSARRKLVTTGGGDDDGEEAVSGNEGDEGPRAKNERDPDEEEGMEGPVEDAFDEDDDDDDGGDYNAEQYFDDGGDDGDDLDGGGDEGGGDYY